MLDNEELARRIAYAFSQSPRGTKAAVARECDIQPQAITGWETKGAIDKKHIPTLARHTKRKVDYFLEASVDDDDSEDASAAPLVSAADDSDYTDVVGYSQSVGLGASGTEAIDYAETHSLKFKKSSLRRRGILNKPLAVYYGKGDSMEPTIMDGDAILFDSSDTRPVDDVLYVIQVAGNGNPEYYVKRAEVLDDGTVLFRTDNPSGDHNWRRSKRMDSKKNPITVIGRVHWIGGWAD